MHPHNPADSKLDTLIHKTAPQNDYRRHARELSLQFLHQLTVQGGHNLNTVNEFLREFCKNNQALGPAKKWIEGTWQHRDEIDAIISEHSSNWDINRISLVDRSNLRLAVYQLMYCPDIPTRVILNEAIELAKTFSTAQAPGFINGLLDIIHKKVRA